MNREAKTREILEDLVAGGFLTIDCALTKIDELYREIDEERIEEAVREMLIYLYYEELHLILIDSIAEELNNREEKAIDEYLGRNQKPGFIPILHAKVDKATYHLAHSIAKALNEQR